MLRITLTIFAILIGIALAFVAPAHAQSSSKCKSMPEIVEWAEANKGKVMKFPAKGWEVWRTHAYTRISMARAMYIKKATFGVAVVFTDTRSVLVVPVHKDHSCLPLLVTKVEAEFARKQLGVDFKAPGSKGA